MDAQADILWVTGDSCGEWLKKKSEILRDDPFVSTVCSCVPASRVIVKVCVD